MSLFLQPPIYGAYLYDAVYQYAIALNKTLEKNQTATGEIIAKKMQNVQYDSKQASHKHLPARTEFPFCMLKSGRANFTIKPRFEIKKLESFCINEFPLQ